MGVREVLGKKILYFDGDVATTFTSKKVPNVDNLSVLNLTHPDMVKSIHREYVEAGVDLICTNTFYANEYQLKNTAYSVEDVISSGVRLAKEAVDHQFIALSISPIGTAIMPYGELSFEEAYTLFQKQVKAGVKAGIDLVLLEGFTDLYEAKAAVLAVKENSSLPVFCTLTFEEDDKTERRTDVRTAITILEGLGIDAVGINPTMKMESLSGLMDEFLKHAHIPLMIKSQGGPPNFKSIKDIHRGSKQDSLQNMKEWIRKGFTIIGDFNGNTPKAMRSLMAEIEDSDLRSSRVWPKKVTAACSSTQTVVFENKARVIGERINPTGKEHMEKAIKAGEYDGIILEAIEQKKQGADLIDVNIGLSAKNAPQVMMDIIKEIQRVVDVPLVIDTMDSKVMEEAARIYNGIPIINSVTADLSSMKRIFPIAKKYGACVIGLTLNQNGLPKTVKERVDMAKFILKTAEEYGISREKVLIDPLVLPLLNFAKDAKDTLDAVEIIKEELQVKVILGITNISYGHKKRKTLNQAYLAQALERGIDAAIFNPEDDEMFQVIESMKL